MCDGKACPCDVDYEDMGVDPIATQAYRDGYDDGYAEASARWTEDYTKILSRLSQIRELAR